MEGGRAPSSIVIGRIRFSVTRRKPWNDSPSPAWKYSQNFTNSQTHHMLNYIFPHKDFMLPEACPQTALTFQSPYIAFHSIWKEKNVQNTVNTNDFSWESFPVRGINRTVSTGHQAGMQLSTQAGCSILALCISNWSAIEQVLFGLCSQVP